MCHSCHHSTPTTGYTVMYCALSALCLPALRFQYFHGVSSRGECSCGMERTDGMYAYAALRVFGDQGICKYDDE